MIKRVITSTPFWCFVIFAMLGLFLLSGSPRESVTTTSAGVTHVALLQSRLSSNLHLALGDLIFGAIGIVFGFLIQLLRGKKRSQ